MVYESDFYTTRRSYRPSYSTYTTSSVPSRQVRVLPGLGKVHIVHSYDRIVPYVGHKRLTVVTMPPKVYSTRPSVLQKEYDWIENKLRPMVSYSAVNRYLNSAPAVRVVYTRYPITGSIYTTYYTPSTYTSYPKYYRWYYSWPREYNYYSYWPYYRYLRGYYNYWPIYNYINDYFSDLEYKINNIRWGGNWPPPKHFPTKCKVKNAFLVFLLYPNPKLFIKHLNMLTYLRNPISGYQYSWWPDAQFYYHYKIYRPTPFRECYWPRDWYASYWPSWRSFRYFMDDVPTEKSLRDLRLRNQLYFS